MSITKKEYSGFEEAYEFFNKRLFGNALPPCLITLQRKARCHGYYSPHRFRSRSDQKTQTDEIALNPDQFIGDSDKEVLSTLVHEMAHCWQNHFGTPSRRGYHNKQWAAKMREIGLMPSATGRPGGMCTGQRMSHYIIEGGKFDLSARSFLSKGFQLNWESNGELLNEGIADRGKNKYTCPACNLNAWAKPGANLVCGTCNKTMIREGFM